MKNTRFEMKVPEDLLARVDDWRRQHPDLPNRSEAIRRLIEAGLSTSGKSGGSSDEGSGGKSKTSAPAPA
jgi:metal-responsive CopG/Arc/MetJ family transcriptional regulator